MRILSTESLARICGQRPWLTIGIWLLALILSVVLIALFLGDAMTSDIEFSNNPDSQQAETLLEERMHQEFQANEIIIIRSETLSVDDQAFQSLVELIQIEIAGLGSDVIDSVINYYLTGEESLVSSDRHTTIMPIVMAGSWDEAIENIGQVTEIVQNHKGQEAFHILITGDASLHEDWMEAAQSDLETAEIIGIPIALFILVLVFGAIAAAFVPLILGIISIVIAVGMVALIGQVNDFSVFIVNMIAAMGFALGIDYSLFIVSRYREERAKGRDKMDAIVASAATASRTVFFSGMTVVLALLGMLIVPTTIFQSLAAGAILVVIVAVIATITLLPAVLSLMGDRINSLRIPIIGRRTYQLEGQRGGFWDRIARTVMRWPVVSLLVTTGILIALVVPISSFSLGASGISFMPDSLESKQGFLILEEDFSFGLISPALIVIDGEINSPEVQQGIEDLNEIIQSDSAFYGLPTLEINESGDLAKLSAPILGDPNEDLAIDAVRRLRNDYIPEVFKDIDANALVTGATAIQIDYIDVTADYLPIVIIFVLALSFILLTMVFRSIVIPIKAIIMNCLSVGATYGLVVLVFQKGFLSNVFGFQDMETFEAWVPIFLFCVLFGLSMDYHVFLLSRIRERYDQTGNNTESVAFGLRSTGSIITGAALIMVAVYSGFAAGDLVMFQQMGFGMAVAIFIDATIVRSLLVPSAMKLLGTVNWYFPKWLKWLPEVRLRE